MSSTDSESGGEGPALQSSRKRRPDTWVRSVKKAKRDSGQAYVSSTSKQVAPKELGPPCACANKCYDKVGDDNVKLLFDSYWALKSHDLQSQYLNKRVSECEVRRSRVKGRESRKKFSKEYSVLVNNSKIIVCLAAFLNIHAISYKRVRNVCSKVSASPTGALAPDQRGRHEPYHKTSPAHLQLIQRFVKSLPTCTSHYSRTKNPDKLYLPPGSTWAGLYDAFKKYMVDHDEEENAIKQSRFILEVQNHKIGIRPPKSDTCSTCDHFKTQMEELDPEEHYKDANIDGSTPSCSTSKTPAGPLSIAGVSSGASSTAHSPGLSSTSSSEDELLLDEDMDLKMEIKEEVIDDALTEFVNVLDHVEQPPEPKECDVDALADPKPSTIPSSSNTEFVNMTPHPMAILSHPVEVLKATKPSSTPSTSSALLKNADPAPPRIEDADEFYLFGMFVASQLRALPLRDALQAQLEIQTILSQKRSERLT